MKLLLFGTGDYYQRYKKWFAGHEILALLDNSFQKQQENIDGLKVISPCDINKFEYDFIIILSFQYEAMKNQLEEMGVSENKIYHFYTLRKLIDWRKKPQVILKRNIISKFEDLDCKKKKILLVSQELTNGGPSLALLQMAIILKKNNYNVTFASMIDGPLGDRVEQEGVPLIIDCNMQLSVMSEEKWVENYDLIVCNTLNFHVFLSERNTDIPCIWWLHDSPFFYAGADKNIIKKIDLRNLYIYSVGPIPKNAIRVINPAFKIKNLLYAVEDINMLYNEQIKEANELIFVTIGFLEEIKGQDILVDAIKNCYERIKGKARFIFIGYNDTLYGNEIINKCKDFDMVTFTGVVERKEIHEYLEISSALICPSRQDSMPTVVAEAMMHSTPCIISDAIGTSNFLKDNVDCLKFPNENAKYLSEILVWCVENKQILDNLGKKARKVYENKFSMDAFENNINKIVTNIFNKENMA